MAKYKVPISSYAAFKKAVLNKGFDIDGYYGYQCWDGAALLWQQLGLYLITGNGLAIGAWDLKRNVNKYNKFDLVTNVNSLKIGDVVCMRPNHIGFFNGWSGGYMTILGQNQGGSPKGSYNSEGFNIVKISKSAFAGAFRYKGWQAKPKPAPAKKSNEAVAKEVMQGKWGNGSERKRRLTQAGYNYNAVQAIVNKLASGGSKARTYTVVRNDNLIAIGRKTRTDWRKIAQLNNLRSPYIIHPGQKLRLP